LHAVHFFVKRKRFQVQVDQFQELLRIGGRLDEGDAEGG
jgi:hypothetical protein